MKLVAIIISILVSTKARSIKENNETICEGFIINGVYHEKEVLKTGIRWAHSLAIDRASDNLYFKYFVSDPVSFPAARLDVNTKDFETILPGVDDVFDLTVDPQTQEVYIEKSFGIYKYDRKNKRTEFYAEQRKTAYTLFFKDVLYYIEYPSQLIYTVSNGETVRFKDLEDTKCVNFFIDAENTMFYNNGSGLFSQKKGTKQSVLIKQAKQSESLSITAITADLNDNVYVSTNDGIYVVKKTEAELVKVVDIKDVFGLAFDSHNNMIYSTYDDHIVRLKPNKNKFCFNLTQSN